MNDFFPISTKPCTTLQMNKSVSKTMRNASDFYDPHCVFEVMT